MVSPGRFRPFTKELFRCEEFYGLPVSPASVRYPRQFRSPRDREAVAWLHAGELAVANGKATIRTRDGNLYCYGIAAGK